MTDQPLPQDPPYSAEAHDAYDAAMEARARVDNNAVNLRLLLTSLYVSSGGRPEDPQSDAWADYHDCLLDAGEGRPFIPYDTRTA